MGRSAMPRVWCRHCGKTVAMRNDGCTRWHRNDAGALCWDAHPDAADGQGSDD